MVRLEPTTDKAFITKCVTDAKSWEASTDDSSPSRDLYFPNVSPPLLWVRAEDYGVFLLVPQNAITAEVHTVLPFNKGKALEIAKCGLKWLFENTHYERLITNVPVFNVPAYKLAVKAGMVKIGINEKSFKKNDIRYDQIILGISKGD